MVVSCGNCGSEFKTFPSRVSSDRGKFCSWNCYISHKKGKPLTHGMSGSPEYNSWESMKARCLNPNNERFSDYGGRGIKVCKHWMKFENFLADMGKRPSGTSLERIDNDKGYEKRNCRWADAVEQQNNTRRNRTISFDGKTMNLFQWARHVGIRPNCLRTRIARGWNLERAFSQPIKQKERGLN